MTEQGVVKSYNDAAGYGFIQRDLGGMDAFVSKNGIQAEGFLSLGVGDRVSFDVVDGPKGPVAKNVSRI